QAKATRKISCETSSPAGGSYLTRKCPLHLISYSLWAPAATSRQSGPISFFSPTSSAGPSLGPACGAWESIGRGKAVSYNKSSPFRLLICAVLTIGLAAVIAVPGQSDEKASSREQQIVDLEKQIQDMNKKLAELRRTNGATIAPPVEGPLSAE